MSTITNGLNHSILRPLIHLCNSLPRGGKKLIFASLKWIALVFLTFFSAALWITPVALAQLTSSEANLVSNPSFETFTGTFGGDGGAQLASGSTQLTSWTVVNGEIAVLTTPNNYSLTPSDGNYFLDLAGYTNTGFPKGISQTLNGLTVGQTYAFTMDLGIRNGVCEIPGNVCTGPILVGVNIGSSQRTFTHDSTLEGNIWGTYGFNFTADNQSMTLTIQGVSLPQGNSYIGLDNVSVTPTISYHYSGFFPPVKNPDVAVNIMKAGAAVPIKFSLGGNFGLAILAADSPPTSKAMTSCGGMPPDDIELTVTAGNSSLSYDTTADQYTYVWKTDKTWVGTCRQFTLTLNDGTVHVAYFQFK